MTCTIVLAHGVLGFGSLGPIGYFNGVAGHLERTFGARVITTEVSAIGSVAQRGAELAQRVTAFGLTEKVHIVAHSMGGLDARYAIAHVPGFASRVQSLVTIGTPHFGSPVADAIVHRTGLLAAIPPLLVSHLQSLGPALDDLTTARCRDIDAQTPDVAGIRYLRIAGDASSGGSSSFFFVLVQQIGQMSEGKNDGVVGFASATRGGPSFAVWPVDHAGEVGWNLDFPVPVGVPLVHHPHLQRYESIVHAVCNI
jgi:triacylglycerol lipase